VLPAVGARRASRRLANGTDARSRAALIKRRSDKLRGVRLRGGVAVSTAAKECQRLGEAHNKPRESSPAGDWEVFTADLLTAIYKRTARALEELTPQIEVIYL